MSYSGFGPTCRRFEPISCRLARALRLAHNAIISFSLTQPQHIMFAHDVVYLTTYSVSVKFILDGSWTLGLRTPEFVSDDESGLRMNGVLAGWIEPVAGVNHHPTLFRPGLPMSPPTPPTAHTFDFLATRRADHCRGEGLRVKVTPHLWLHASYPYNAHPLLPTEILPGPSAIYTPFTLLSLFISTGVCSRNDEGSNLYLTSAVHDHGIYHHWRPSIVFGFRSTFFGSLQMNMTPDSEAASDTRRCNKRKKVFPLREKSISIGFPIGPKCLGNFANGRLGTKTLIRILRIRINKLEEPSPLHLTFTKRAVWRVWGGAQGEKLTADTSGCILFRLVYRLSTSQTREPIGDPPALPRPLCLLYRVIVCGVILRVVSLGSHAVISGSRSRTYVPWTVPCPLPVTEVRRTISLIPKSLSTARYKNNVPGHGADGLPGDEAAAAPRDAVRVLMRAAQRGLRNAKNGESLTVHARFQEESRSIVTNKCNVLPVPSWGKTLGFRTMSTVSTFALVHLLYMR
ncbi:hypothetical protein J6590_004311 [Homalodisca vitripennis]|nr:hypothetical protein J6590_004311 [Homalodisca vitripennis]